MASMIDDKAGRGEAQGSRRPRQQAKRSHRVGFSLTGEEYELLEAAAGRAGRATAAYAAEAALTAAQGRSMEQDTLRVIQGQGRYVKFILSGGVAP